MMKYKAGILFLILISLTLIQDFLWSFPYLLFFLLLSLSIFTLLKFKSNTNLFLFFLMGVNGPLIEILLIRLNILEYYIFGENGLISLFGLLPIWIPFSWAISAVLIREISILGSNYILKYDKGEKPNKKNIYLKIFSVLFLSFFIIACLSFSENTTSAILIIFVGIAFFEYLRKNLHDKVYFIIGILVGLIAEGSLLQTGIYHYSGFSFLNIPLWMILMYGIIGILIYRISLILKYFFKNKLNISN